MRYRRLRDPDSRTAETGKEIAKWWVALDVRVSFSRGLMFWPQAETAPKGDFPNPVMSSDANVNRWYALLVRSRWESSASNLLAGKGYRIFLPTSAAAKRSRANLREAA